MADIPQTRYAGPRTASESRAQCSVPAPWSPSTGSSDRSGACGTSRRSRLGGDDRA